MEKPIYYNSIKVKRNTRLGPKPRLKRQLKPCTETQILETQKKLLEVSSVGLHETSNVKTVEEISAKEMDDVKELVGGEFDVGRINEPEKEYECEEDEAGEVYEPGQEDEVEFMHTDLQDGAEVEFEPEENSQRGGNEGDYDSGVEYKIRDTVRTMEYFSDEFERNEDDDMLYNKTGRMVDVDEECCHKVVNRSDDKSCNIELFVGGLDRNATEDDIKKVFSKVGEVVNIKLMMNPLTNKNRGFAFVQYATMEQTNRALAELKKPVVNGKESNVSPCKGSNTLFLGNICRDWTEQRVLEKLKSFGIEELKDLRLARDINNKRINRGFAFLEFSSHPDAITAYKRLQKPDVVLGDDLSAKVCFAYPHVKLRNKVVPKASKVFLDGISPSWDYEDVRELVKKFGNIEKIELARYKPSAKRRDYGFVTFCSHEAAISCAEAINSAEFPKGHHKIKIKATLSQPFLKRKWKHQVCGNFHLVEGPNSGSSIFMHETRELKRSMRSSSPRHKRALGYSNKYPYMPKSRSPRPLPPPERSYKRKSSVSIYPKMSMKKPYTEQEDLPPRKRYASHCDSRVGKSHERRYPFERLRRSIDSCRGSSYSQTRECACETCSHSSLASSHKADAYDHSSYSGSKRHHSTLENIPRSYANSQHRGSRSHSGHKIYETNSQYSDVYRNEYQYVDVYKNASPYEDFYYNRPKSFHLRHAVRSRNRSPSPESKRGCCVYQESVYRHSSFGDANDITYSPSYCSDYLSPVQGRSKSSVFPRLGSRSSKALGRF